MKALISITLRPDVFDPQGQAITQALHSLGFEGVKQVRYGKSIEIELTEKDSTQTNILLSQMCDKLLVNSVIETYTVKITEDSE